MSIELNTILGDTMFYLIYKITNNINGKFYIGAHRTVDKNDGYMGSGKLISLAIQKYGIENFTKEILLECTSSKDMYAKEKELVKLCEQSYNLKEGGDGGFDFINESGLNGTKNGVIKRLSLIQDTNWFQNWKEKQHIGYLKHITTISKDEFSKRGKKANQTCLERNGKYSFQGSHHNDATKEAIGLKNSKYQSGTGNSQFGTIWITDGIKNTKIKKDSVIPDGWYKGRK